MWLDRVSNPGPLALESDVLPTEPLLLSCFANISLTLQNDVLIET